MKLECSKCGEDKDLGEFYKRNSKKGYMSSCKACHKQYMKDKHTEVKLQLVEMFGGKCLDCGYDAEPRVLQFHHRDPNKKDFQISKRTRYRIDNLIEECKKCDLLCPTCHAIKHL